MKPSRHQAREVALQILYRYDSAIQSAAASQGEAQEQAAAPIPVPSTPNAVLDDLNRHFAHFGVAPELRGFATELVAGTLKNLASLDALLEKHASNWKVARMSAVDRNLLRMSIYELQHFKDTPVSVVIDEAIELAKQFGTQESPAFVNGVLDAVKGSVSR